MRWRAPGGLVHLAEDHRRLVEDVRLDQLVQQVVPLAGALADAGEHGVAAVAGCDVVDKLLEDHGLAYPGASEEAELAAAREGADQVENLEAGLEHLVRGHLLLVIGSGPVQAACRGASSETGSLPSIGSPMTLNSRPSTSSPTGNLDRRSRVDDARAPGQAVRRVHRHATHQVFAEVLLHLEYQAFIAGAILFDNFEGVVYRGQFLPAEIDVENDADDFSDRSFLHDRTHLVCLCTRLLFVPLFSNQLLRYGLGASDDIHQLERKWRPAAPCSFPASILR